MSSAIANKFARRHCRSQDESGSALIFLELPLTPGATLITESIERFPIFVWAGSALLGWIAGEMFAKDPALHELGMPAGNIAHYVSAAIGALAVLAVGYWLKRRNGLVKSESS